jgi:hypothetical protein
MKFELLPVLRMVVMPSQHHADFSCDSCPDSPSSLYLYITLQAPLGLIQKEETSFFTTLLLYCNPITKAQKSSFPASLAANKMLQVNNLAIICPGKFIYSHLQ